MDVIPIYILILIPAFICLIINKISGVHKRVGLDVFLVLLLILFLWGGVTLLWVPIVERGLVTLFIFFMEIILYYYTYNILLEKKEILKRIMWWWVIFGLLVAIANFLIRYGPFVEYISTITDTLSFNFYIRNLDLNQRSATIASANVTATIQNLSFCILCGLFFIERNKMKKKIMVVMFLIMIWGFLLTMSKAGLISFVAMFFFMFSVFKETRNFFIRYCFFFIVLVAIIFYFQVLYLDSERTARLVYDITTKSVSITSRLGFWEKGWEALININGIGLGPGGYTTISGITFAHSLYFSILFDFGIIGFLLMIVGILILIGRLFTRLIKYQDQYYSKMFLASCGGWVAIAIHGLVDIHYNFSFLLFFLAISSATFQHSLKETNHFDE